MTAPTLEQVAAARDQLEAVLEQLPASPAVAAYCRGTVEALAWVLGEGESARLPDESGDRS